MRDRKLEREFFFFGVGPVGMRGLLGCSRYFERVERRMRWSFVFLWMCGPVGLREGESSWKF